MNNEQKKQIDDLFGDEIVINRTEPTTKEKELYGTIQAVIDNNIAQPTTTSDYYIQCSRRIEANRIKDMQRYIAHRAYERSKGVNGMYYESEQRDANKVSEWKTKQIKEEEKYLLKIADPIKVKDNGKDDDLFDSIK